MRNLDLRVLLLALLLAPTRIAHAETDAAAVAFPQGVASGEVTAEAALLWTRTDRPARVILEISTDPAFRRRVRRKNALATRDHDFTLKVVVDDLAPGNLYYYRFRSGGAVSDAGKLRTPPARFVDAPVRFGWSSDLDGSATPPINRFETLDRAREDHLDFFVYNGDNIYADNPPACGPDPACFAGKYQQNRSYPALRALLEDTGAYAVWDDHEVSDNFSPETVAPDLLAVGRQAFERYMPVPSFDRELGFFRTFRWGRQVELFVLDERSFRTAEADGVCQGDLLPTLPSEIRGQVGLPPAPPKGCLDALADPKRSILGPRQKEAFRDALERSDAVWKIVVNEVAIAELFGLPYDRWEGYSSERRELLDFVQSAGIRNVVFLTGDLHSNMIVDVRPSVFEDPDAVATEAIAGPVAEHTLLEELTGLLGSQDQALGFIGLVDSLAMPSCHVPNAYGYGLVEADPASLTLTITLKDGAGSALCRARLQAK